MWLRCYDVVVLLHVCNTYMFCVSSQLATFNYDWWITRIWLNLLVEHNRLIVTALEERQVSSLLPVAAWRWVNRKYWAWFGWGAARTHWGCDHDQRILKPGLKLPQPRGRLMRTEKNLSSNPPRYHRQGQITNTATTSLERGRRCRRRTGGEKTD